MSLTELEVHFQKVQQIGEELDSIATLFQKLSEDYGSRIVSDTAKIWEGDSAVIFQTNWKTLISLLQESARSFTLLATDIKQKTAKMYEAEKGNECRATFRNYSLT